MIQSDEVGSDQSAGWTRAKEQETSVLPHCSSRLWYPPCLLCHIVPPGSGTHRVFYATLFQQALIPTVSPMPHCSSRLWYPPCLLCHIVPAGSDTHGIFYATLFQQALILIVSPVPHCSSWL